MISYVKEIEFLSKTLLLRDNACQYFQACDLCPYANVNNECKLMESAKFIVEYIGGDDDDDNGSERVYVEDT